MDHLPLFSNPDGPPADASEGAGSGAPLIAKVLIEGQGELLLDYAVPVELADQILPGIRVRVPLQNRLVLGVVTDFLGGSADAAPELPLEQVGPGGLKAVQGISGTAPLLSPPLLKLADWAAGYYLAPRSSIIRAMLPDAVRKREDPGLQRQTVELAKHLPPEELEGLKRRAPRQAQLLNTLMGNEDGRMTVAALQKLHGDGVRAAVQALAAKGLLRLKLQPHQRDPLERESFTQSRPLPLNVDQQAALDAILAALKPAEDAGKVPAPPKPVLLQGVTGSGKTEVYLQAIASVLEQQRSAIVLVPEISLTPQTIERFQSRFARLRERIAVLHSHLSAGERYDEWDKLRNQPFSVAIGARSAIFAPVRRLGLIIVDEEHEPSYKQDKQPRYHARDLAVVRAAMEGAGVVLGSATPSLESWHNARQGRYLHLHLPVRADDRQMPVVFVDDMRKRRPSSADPAMQFLSPRLRQAIDHRLGQGEQVILFLNRRGYATSMICPACGHVEHCSRCSIAMTWHREENRLLCHLCGAAKVPPKKCSECQDPGVHFAGYGTQKIEALLRQIFKGARIARVDADSMRRKGQLRDVLRDFRARKIDILLGTQMIAKGLDFPGVTLVGVLNADLSLHLPDFRAAERTFQLLAQVAGRAGRGDLRGEVVIQTYSPHSPAIQFARHHDFEGFASQEIEFRKAFGYPPFSRFILVMTRSTKAAHAEFTLQNLHHQLARDLPAGITLSDPMPAPIAKVEDLHRFQMVVRGMPPRMLIDYLRGVLEKFQAPKEVILTIDIDPIAVV